MFIFIDWFDSNRAYHVYAFYRPYVQEVLLKKHSPAHICFKSGYKSGYRNPIKKLPPAEAEGRKRRPARKMKKPRKSINLYGSAPASNASRQSNRSGPPLALLICISNSWLESCHPSRFLPAPAFQYPLI